jgi:hypothetical protein
MSHSTVASYLYSAPASTAVSHSMHVCCGAASTTSSAYSLLSMTNLAACSLVAASMARPHTLLSGVGGGTTAATYTRPSTPCGSSAGQAPPAALVAGCVSAHGDSCHLLGLLFCWVCHKNPPFPSKMAGPPHKPPACQDPHLSGPAWLLFLTPPPYACAPTSMQACRDDSTGTTSCARP